jgi:hypothetical protein
LAKKTITTVMVKPRAITILKMILLKHYKNEEED